jgi:hypothetical protein
MRETYCGKENFVRGGGAVTDEKLDKEKLSFPNRRPNPDLAY